MAMLPTSTLSIPFAQLLIFLRLLILACSRLGSVSWEIWDLTSTVPTPTQWLTRSFVNSFPVYLTGYVTQSHMMQRPPHGLSAWNLLIHASPLSYFLMSKPFLLVSTLGLHVSLPRGRLVNLIKSFTWVSWLWAQKKLWCLGKGMCPSIYSYLLITYASDSERESSLSSELSCSSGVPCLLMHRLLCAILIALRSTLTDLLATQ